jgi:hypothetical protein
MASTITAFFRRLFGGGGGAPQEPAAASVEYKGYTIQPLPERSGGQYRVAGVIRKEFPDGVKEHRFIRADTCSTRDEAESFTVDKAQRIIDEQGDRLFQPR